jgi:hypothetical protein
MREKRTGDTHIQMINSPVIVVDDDSDKVVIKWSWEDVQSLRPDLSEKESLVMLHKIAGRLEDRLIEMGWQIMETLIQMNEEADE